MDHPSVDLETVPVRLDGCGGSFHESECDRVRAPGQSSLLVSSAGDDDARFLFLWIGFNAAYADEEEVQNEAAPERDAFRVLRKGRGPRCRPADLRRDLRQLPGTHPGAPSQQVQDHPFWKYHNGVAGFEDWEEWFRATERRFRRALEERDTSRVLRLVFDRLALRPSQPNRPRRRDLEQPGQPGPSARRRGDPRLSHARLRRRHDGQPARGLGASLLPGRGPGSRGGRRPQVRLANPLDADQIRLGDARGSLLVTRCTGTAPSTDIAPSGGLVPSLATRDRGDGLRLGTVSIYTGAIRQRARGRRVPAGPKTAIVYAGPAMREGDTR